MGLTLLHISDLHFGWDGDDRNKLADRKICLDGLLSEVRALDTNWKPSVICLSGDIGWRGAASDYEQAKKWLDRLLAECDIPYSHLIICTGNHDAARSEARKNARPSEASEADEVLGVPVADQFIAPFKAFEQFCQSAGIQAMRLADQQSYLAGERVLEMNRFVTLNSAWFAKDDKDKEKLWMGFPQIRYLEANGQMPLISGNEGGKLTIALTHHPKEWLHPQESNAYGNRPNTWDYIASRCHVLLTGHTHGEVRRADRIAEGAYHFTGGSAYAGASHFNSFRLVRVEANEIVYRSFEFDPRSVENHWKSSEAVKLPLVVNSPLSKRGEHREQLPSIDLLRVALKTDAERLLDRKSRLLRPSGPLPGVLRQQVSVWLEGQPGSSEAENIGRRGARIDVQIPLYEAVRRNRRTLLLGDLGAGKSTAAGDLIIETFSRSESTVAAIIPLKSLNLAGQFTVQEMLREVDNYLSNQAAPNLTPVSVNSLLQSKVEILLVFDGLDEMALILAARFLNRAATLPQHWPNIQVVVTGRPLELTGAAYADWQIVRMRQLDDDAKTDFLKAELIADGIEPAVASEQAAGLLRNLKELPELDAVANSPLAIRLVYLRLRAAQDPVGDLTLGHMLYDLLLERLGGWQRRDDKPEAFDEFERAFPTSQAKAECLSLLARTVFAARLTPDAAKACLLDLPASANANKHRLAEEALSYFELCGLVTTGEWVEFPLRPILEVAAAVGIEHEWSRQTTNWHLPPREQWRAVSFVAAISRRRGHLAELRRPITDYIDLLLLGTGYLPAVCYVCAEANDPKLAEESVARFGRLGHRPLSFFGNQWSISARNIAKTIWLAGAQGFKWFYSQYLDPRYPIPNTASLIPTSVFAQWSGLAFGHVTSEQSELLEKLVPPFSATGEAHFYGVLANLAMLVPQAFTVQDRLWYQSRLLGNSFLGKQAWNSFEVAANGREKAYVSQVLLRRVYENVSAALLWFQLNPQTEPPIPIITAAFKWVAKAERKFDATKLAISCEDALGREHWLRFARWILTGPNADAASGAAIILHRYGELRLTVLGAPLLRAMHDGGYVAEAEAILSSLIDKDLTFGLKWLADQIAGACDLLSGAHSGWWRILLKRIGTLPVGPRLLADCIGNMGPFTLPRYPEVRDALARLVHGSQGRLFSQALRELLHSLDPNVRHAAAMVLTTVSPGEEAEALFVVVQSRVGEHYRVSSWHEWEAFCLTLNFTPSVLALLKSRLGALSQQSRAFALVLLAKNKIDIEADYLTEFTTALVGVEDLYLETEGLEKAAITSQQAVRLLLDILNNKQAKIAERAASCLLARHSQDLTPVQEAKCAALTTSDLEWAWDLSKYLRRIRSESAFVEALGSACKEIVEQTGKQPFLQLVLNAKADGKAWKDVLWAMLCSDVHLSMKVDELGETLLDYGRDFPDDGELIGRACKDCLNDPRVQSGHRVDAYHWLAVLAHEFDGLASDKVREALTRIAQPITGAAAAALIARLGEVPASLKFERSSRNGPSFVDSVREADRSKIFDRLKDYSRDSVELHPQTLTAIEESLYHPVFPEAQLVELAASGQPGVLIVTALRYGYGSAPKLAEAVSLLDFWITQTRPGYENRKEVQQLMGIWRVVRASVLNYDKQELAAYLVALDNALAQGNFWPLSVATEILRMRGLLSDSQVGGVFREYVRSATPLHKRLLAQIVVWLAGELEEKMRDAVLKAAHDAVLILNEEKWDNADGWHRSPYGFLLMPLVVWAIGSQVSPSSEAVFLRGIKFLFEAPALDEGNVSSVLAGLDPLLKKAPPEILSSVLRHGTESFDPAVRAFCRLVVSLASGAEVSPALLVSRSAEPTAGAATDSNKRVILTRGDSAFRNPGVDDTPP